MKIVFVLKFLHLCDMTTIYYNKLASVGSYVFNHLKLWLTSWYCILAMVTQVYFCRFIITLMKAMYSNFELMIHCWPIAFFFCLNFISRPMWTTILSIQLMEIYSLRAKKRTVPDFRMHSEKNEYYPISSEINFFKFQASNHRPANLVEI